MLGATWDSQLDLLSFPVKAIIDLEPVMTKRTLFHLVASLFDLSSLISPFVLRGKIFLQQLWKNNNDCDKQVGDELQVQIARWRGEIPLFSFSFLAISSFLVIILKCIYLLTLLRAGRAVVYILFLED